MEQTQQQVTNFLLEGPSTFQYRLHGHMEFKLDISQKFTSVTYTAPGKITLEVPGGGKLTIETKTIEITGLLSGEKHLQAVGSVVITDLCADL